MKRLCIAIAMVLAVTGAASAQESDWAVGLRVGGANGGLTVKRYLGTQAVEVGVALASDNSGRLQALYEWYKPLGTEGLRYYYGVGAFVGAYDYSSSPQMGIGVEGVVGVEYRFTGIPIAFSLDYRPSLSLIPDFSKSMYGDLGLGLKFCF